jgi:hypothetical protein
MHLLQRSWLLCLLTLITVVSTSIAAEPDTKLYELRTYHAAEGKLDALLSRFRDHTTKLFAKHGMTNVGYWVPSDNPERKLIYLLSYPNTEAKAKAWQGFLNDADWKAVHAASEKDGKLVTKIESQLLQATDYSPALKIENLGSRVFEMRTYTTGPNNLSHLDKRFREHTVKLFEKHGMQNIAYFHLVKDQPEADVTLLYFLSHKDRAAAKESFATFGKDADWQAARKASETAAGGSLTIKGGVRSLFLEPTDFSPLR